MPYGIIEGSSLLVNDLIKWLKSSVILKISNDFTWFPFS